MEIAAYNSYNEIDYEINFWRTKSGLEVDFVLGRGEVAIEVKGVARIEKGDLRPLNAFIEEYSPRKALVETFAQPSLLPNFGHCEEQSDAAISWLINVL